MTTSSTSEAGSRKTLPLATSLLISLDPAQPETLQQQICGAVRRAIAEGVLRPGARLPSSRALAIDLAVSRTTTSLAYEQMAAEGYLETRRGAGTFVAAELPDQRVTRLIAPRTPGTRRQISSRAAAIAGVPPNARRLGRGARPFRLGVPALDLFPVRIWAQLTQRRLRSLTMSQLDYGEPPGFRPLREAIAAHVQLARGTSCEPDQVVIVSGAQRALDVLCRLLLDPGDAALLEEPGYPGARAALVAAGAVVRSVPVDDEGMNIDAVAGLSDGARLVYATPSHQFPLGVSMTLARRKALLDWASRAGAWVVEDDYDSEFRYGVSPLPSLHGIDADGRVIYVGTFSKSLFPSLRLGFVLAPQDLIEPLLAASRAIHDAPHTLEQAVLADFMAAGHYERHLRRMRGAYRERFEAIRDSAAECCGDSLRLRSSTAGLHVTGELSVRDREVAEAAARRGIETMPLSSYCQSPMTLNGLVLGFGGVRADAVREGMARLADAIDEVASARITNGERGRHSTRSVPTTAA